MLCIAIYIIIISLCLRYASSTGIFYSFLALLCCKIKSNRLQF